MPTFIKGKYTGSAGIIVGCGVNNLGVNTGALADIGVKTFALGLSLDVMGFGGVVVAAAVPVAVVAEAAGVLVVAGALAGLGILAEGCAS
jgi:hypothetical protein